MNTIYIILIVLIVPILLALVAVIIFFGYVFLVYPRVRFEKMTPLTGKLDGNSEVKTAGTTSYLVSNGLPYPTDMEKSSHPGQSLSGKASMRFDPDDIGELEKWYEGGEEKAPWESVTIPSCYNAANSAHTNYQGYTWYRISFKPGFAYKDHHFIRLCFQGVLLRCKVWLNGHLLGEREGGYTPFYFDISDNINFKSENVLIVRSDNRSTPFSLPPEIRSDHNPGWHTYGGIYRDVLIEMIPGQYVFKSSLNAVKEDENIKLDIGMLTHNYTAKNKYTITCTVKDPDNRQVGKLTFENSSPVEVCEHNGYILIKKPVLWNPQKPRLYSMSINMTAAGTKQKLSFKTGLRFINVNGTDLLFNGKEIFLKGICKHEDDPDLGPVQTKKIISRDLNLIRKMNANYIRLAHYPHHPDELRAARDMGFLLSEEIPLYQAGAGFTAWFEEKKGLRLFPAKLFGLKQMHNHKLMMNSARQLVEMIERDRNNPSIIMWSIANETYDLFESGGKLYKWLRDICRQFDPTRPVTMAELTYDIPIFDKNRRAMKHMDVISINSYYGWYYSKTSQLEKMIEDVHQRFPDKPVILSEFGADAGPGRSDSDGTWKAERVDYGKTYSEEYQEKVITDYWNTVKDKSWVTGISPWVFSDFYNTWFPNNPIPNFNLKGITSGDRKPKKAYFALKKIYSGIKT